MLSLTRVWSTNSPKEQKIDVSIRSLVSMAEKEIESNKFSSSEFEQTRERESFSQKAFPENLKK